MDQLSVVPVDTKAATRPPFGVSPSIHSRVGLSLSAKLAGGLVLGEFHRIGYAHGDFKPNNLLIDPQTSITGRSQHSLLRDNERLVLSDYGATRSADSPAAIGQGTPGYAAPELLSTVIKHDPRIDLYAATITLVEAASGFRPQQVTSVHDSPFPDEALAVTGSLSEAI